MVEFTTTILQFDRQGEKTGWTYINIPTDIAGQLKPGVRTSFYVKGFLDEYPVSQLSLLPMGGGNFIMTLNGALRKKIHKRKGAMVRVRIAADDTPFVVPRWITDCLEDEPDALAYFNKLAPSHQKYYIKWIEGAKTDATKTKRLAQSVSAFLSKMTYGEMIRHYQGKG
jgi:hypothetical protein